MRETIQNTNGKQFHAVSLSGGKDSTAMLLLMIERDMPINMVLSADTGMEFPEMYEHLAKLDEHLFRERGIHITTLRHPKGFEYLMFDEPKQKPRSLENRAKLGIPPYGNGWPGIRVRWCTGQLKTHLITKEVNRLKGELGAIHYGEATRLTVMNAALDRIEAVLDEPELPDNGNQHILSQAQPDQPEVQFSDVGFAYQDKEVLHNISFSMQKNTMTALVGPSGGGKSTIANLLARLWDVKSGKVTIRGTDIRDVPLAELMEQISMVFQRVYLFQDTIYNNISMGKPDATEEEVYEAAKKARCYDFIMALPDGFQTVIGEGGATLSGGEKQRISIARCILKDAPIVILDEATASVDTDNESYIQEAINELVKGKTLLVIAHRLNTIRQADQILVISDGRISEQGTHDELMAKAGIYQDFVNIRKKSSGWSLA